MDHAAGQVWEWFHFQGLLTVFTNESLGQITKEAIKNSRGDCGGWGHVKGRIKERDIASWPTAVMGLCSSNSSIFPLRKKGLWEMWRCCISKTFGMDCGVIGGVPLMLLFMYRYCEEGTCQGERGWQKASSHYPVCCSVYFKSILFLHLYKTNNWLWQWYKGWTTLAHCGTSLLGNLCSGVPAILAEISSELCFGRKLLLSNPPSLPTLISQVPHPHCGLKALSAWSRFLSLHPSKGFFRINYTLVIPSWHLLLLIGSDWTTSNSKRLKKISHEIKK